MNRIVVTASVGLAAAAIPLTAHAQYIPTVFIVAALSPLLVIALAIALGVVSCSWRRGGLHVLLVVTWIVLFAIASYFIENDYVIWTPMALYVAHAVIIVALLLIQIARRVTGEHR